VVAESERIQVPQHIQDKPADTQFVVSSVKRSKERTMYPGRTDLYDWHIMLC